ncbi:hypothetical protein [Gracilibacillus thailandensis]|uniref:hypothetical protein n=1 Tax=Gracilibacillus thailandensis TaxID=563735 RepID=UPI001F090D9E|nr:hypothetical protein [Gracilibacillus thailandensis]
MQKKIKYNLNEESLNFILLFEKSVSSGKVFSKKELVELFIESSFYDDVINTYYETAIYKAIWWAVKRSGSWKMNRGSYTKIYI